MEKISNWDPTAPKSASVNPDAGIGDTTILPLTRAIKRTDILLVIWCKSSVTNQDAEVAGQSYLYPNSYDYDVLLDVVEDFQEPSSYYSLNIEQASIEAGSTSVKAMSVSQGGNSYGPTYKIFGIYNVSGK